MINVKCEELNISSESISTENDKYKLNNYKANLIYIISDINAQIEDYKVDFVQQGVNGNYEWLRKAKYKKRSYALLVELVKTRIGEINVNQKKIKQNSIERNLIEECKKHVSEEEFDLIVRKAVEITNKNEK